MSLTLDSWSFSTLLSYEQCAFRIKLKKIDKIPEPPRDPDNDPLARGNRIHDNLEGVIKGTADLSKNEAKKVGEFKNMLAKLNELYLAGVATAEADWIYNRDWERCGKSGYWLWAKLDYSAQDEAERLVVLGDWKSGKSYYKMPEHIQQTQFYAGLAALEYEWADRIITEIPYVDEGHILSREYTREDALRFVGRFEQRADRMLNDKFFRPNPNMHTCKYCPYGPRNGNGHCPVGV